MISHSTRLRALLAHLQSQRVLVAAWVLALSSAFAVPPDRAYGGYVDYRTEASRIELPRAKEQPVWVYVVVTD